MEVRGKVTLLSPLTVVTGGTPPVSVGCVVPAGATLNVKVDDMIELKCDLIAGVWTVRVAHGEDEDEDEDSGDDDSSKVEVRGTITLLTDATVAVDTVNSCTIPSSVLAQLKLQFKVGDVVKMECVDIGGALPTLKEIEKKGGGSGEQSGGGSGSGGSDD